VSGVLGRTHALSGAAAGAAAGVAVSHLAPGSMAAGAATGLGVAHLSPAGVAVAAVLTAGAAVLPDIDHPDATIARSFGLLTRAFAWLVEHLSGGHRHGTHSLAGVAAFTAGAYAAVLYRHTLPGEIALGLLMSLVIAAALRALRIGGHAADLLAVAAAAGVIWTGYGIASLSWTVALGTGTHLIGDMLTDEGVPLAWPLSRRHFRLLPEPLAFTTGTRPERWLVAPLLLIALAWLAFLAAGGPHLLSRGRLPSVHA
jgi:membrane-bound metal-dependent hydrolase YbcI (DUF457 family)